MDAVDEAILEARNEALEEAARVAEDFPYTFSHARSELLALIAEAIRKKAEK